MIKNPWFLQCILYLPGLTSKHITTEVFRDIARDAYNTRDQFWVQCNRNISKENDNENSWNILRNELEHLENLERVGRKEIEASKTKQKLWNI